MHNRALDFIRARLYFGLLVVCGLFQAHDVLAGEGYIVLDQNMSIRPLLFFSDTLGGNRWDECQNRMYLYRSSNGTGRLFGMDSDDTFSASVPQYSHYYNVGGVNLTWTHPAQSHNFKNLTFDSVTLLQGQYKWVSGWWDVAGPQFQQSTEYGAPVYAWWIGLSGYKLAYQFSSGAPVSMTTVPDQPVLNLNVVVYYLPASLGLTTSMLQELPWGWWGDSSRYGVDASYNVISLNTGLNDNPSFPPDVPLNPLTGNVYPPGVFDWVWDSSSQRWVGHNKWTDATTVPSVPGGPTGQWVYGKNPNGNIFNPDPEGSEWYWDGTKFTEVVLPGTGTDDPADPWTDGGGTTVAPLSSEQTVQLLSAIEQNTRSSKASLLGLSTAIPGFRGEVHSDLGLIQQRLLANQTELMSCLNGHHHTVEYSLGVISADVAASRTLQQSILNELSSGFGGVSGALSGIGSDMASVASSASTIAQNTANVVAKQEAAFTSMNQGFSDVGGKLGDIESRVSDAVGGLERIEGKILTGNELAQENLDMWASQIIHWNDSDDQSLAKLQHLCDVADTLKSYNENIATDSNHMRLFWELEKIRWVSRDADQAQVMSGIDGKLQVGNDKLTDLINEVASIPPVDVPEVDLSTVEQNLGQVVQALNGGSATDLSGVMSELATIKYRLGNIDNALSARTDVEPVGAVQLHAVQEDVRDNLLTKLQSVWNKLTAFEDSSRPKIDYQNMGNGRVANPVWFDKEIKWGALDWRLKLDWSDPSYTWVTEFRPLWRLIEIWFLYLLCLYQCHKVLMEV